MIAETIPEIASELERLASEITSINARPFGDRIDIRIVSDADAGSDEEISEPLQQN